MSDFSQCIPQYFCFGYLLSEHPHQHSFLDRISTRCRRFNEEKNRQVLSNTFTHPQMPQCQFTDSKKYYQPSSSKFIIVSNATSPSSSLHLQVSLDLSVNHLVDTQQKTQLSSLLCEYSPLFDNSHHNVSNIVINHVFNTVPHSPPAFRPHRNPHNREETQCLIDEFLEAGNIQESKSPYVAPGFIVPRKENRSGRLVVNYRALNKITIPDASPLPHGEDLLQELEQDYKYFSKLDRKLGYHQLRISMADRPKTAFVVSQGHYEFLVLPMEPQNAPAAFQKTMFKVMKPYRDFCFIFLDDITVYSKTFNEHISHLWLAFDTLAKAKLILNASKCEPAVEKVLALGHIVSQTSITPTNEAIQAILDLPEPRTLKQANKFLWSLACYRKFVPNFAHIVAPIHKVTNLTKTKRNLFK